MISFTHWPNNPSASSVFSLDFGYDTTKYKIGYYDAEKGRYVEFHEGFQVIPGYAYWLLARDGLNVNFDGVSVSTDRQVEVMLKYNSETGDGWNMIASPNDELYYWEYIEIVLYNKSENHILKIRELQDDNEYISTNLWSWDDGEYKADNDVILPGKGYWVKVKDNGISIRFVQTGNDYNYEERKSVKSNDSDGEPPQPMGSFLDNFKDIGGGCFIDSLVVLNK